MSHGDLVQVLWRDSMTFDQGWGDIADYVKDATDGGMEHLSVGYVIHDDQTKVVLAQSREAVNGRGEDGPRVCNCIAIPHVAILRVDDIQPPLAEQEKEQG